MSLPFSAASGENPLNLIITENMLGCNFLKQANNIGHTLLIYIHVNLPRFLRPALCSEVRLQLAGFVTVQRVKILLTRNLCKGAPAACIQTLLGTLIILCPAGVRNMIWLLAMVTRQVQTEDWQATTSF